MLPTFAPSLSCILYCSARKACSDNSVHATSACHARTGPPTHPHGQCQHSPPVWYRAIQCANFPPPM